MAAQSLVRACPILPKDGEFTGGGRFQEVGAANDGHHALSAGPVP